MLINLVNKSHTKSQIFINRPLNADLRANEIVAQQSTPTKNCVWIQSFTYLKVRKFHRAHLRGQLINRKKSKSRLRPKLISWPRKCARWNFLTFKYVKLCIQTHFFVGVDCWATISFARKSAFKWFFVNKSHLLTPLFINVNYLLPH